jgi:hypothetical protein
MKTNGKKLQNRSKPYPEQSTRQALRGLRRQQGGPGILRGCATATAGVDVATEAALGQA